METDSGIDPTSLSSDDLLDALRKLGGPVGPITSDTRKYYERKLIRMLSGGESSLGEESDPLIVSLQFEDRQTPAPKVEKPPESHILVLPNIEPADRQNPPSLPKHLLSVNTPEQRNGKLGGEALDPTQNDHSGVFATSTPKEGTKVIKLTHPSPNISDLKDLSQIELTPPIDVYYSRDETLPSTSSMSASSLRLDSDEELRRRSAWRARRRELEVHINSLYNRPLASPDWLRYPTATSPSRSPPVPTSTILKTARSRRYIPTILTQHLRLWIAGVLILTLLLVWCYFNMEAPTPNPFFE